MRTLRRLWRGGKAAFFAVAVWSAVCGTALAQAPQRQTPQFASKFGQNAQKKEGSGEFVTSYALVLAGIGLGLLLVCRTSNRRDRARPEQYAESKDHGHGIGSAGGTLSWRWFTVGHFQHVDAGNQGSLNAPDRSRENKSKAPQIHARNLHDLTPVDGLDFLVDLVRRPGQRRRKGLSLSLPEGNARQRAGGDRGAHAHAGAWSRISAWCVRAAATKWNRAGRGSPTSSST